MATRKMRPPLIMAPHSAVEGWTPRPKKLTTEAARSAFAMCRLPWTRMGGTTLRKMWRGSPGPSAAHTKQRMAAASPDPTHEHAA